MGTDKLRYPSLSRFTIKEASPMRQPREMVDRMGVEGVDDYILLAILLRSGVRGTNVADLAWHLIQDYGSLAELAKASVPELARRHGIGKVKAQIIRSALELGRRSAREQSPVRPNIRTPADAAQVLRELARHLDQEKFWVLLLDAKSRLMRPPLEITMGIVDASLVHPREVFKQAIRASSAAVVLAHNHPSGDPNPSAEDIRITRQLVEASRIVQIDVLDHIIVGSRPIAGREDFFSLREAGLVTF